MPELRKRKHAPAPIITAPKKLKSTAAARGLVSPSVSKPKPTGQIAAGQKISQDRFHGEVRTNDDETTDLNALLNSSDAGVIIFTYPKASTPGCNILGSGRM